MQFQEYFEFHDRTKLVYGPGTIKQAGREARLLGGARAVLITDGVIHGLGFPNTIIKSLEDAGIEVVLVRDDVPQDSSVTIITETSAEAKARGADVCIGIGGGSVLDTMKMVNLLITEGGDLLKNHQGAYIQERPLKPMIAIPTTAGTGSEVTFAAMVKDHDSSMKLSFVSHFFAPNVSILDPNVTLSMPKQITASTGIDALTHGIESLTSTQATPITEALSAGSIGAVHACLPVAVENGGDVEARGRMLTASCQAGLAIANSFVGVVHGVAHSIGGIAGVPHGLANSLMLPVCMEWNMEYSLDKYAIAAHAMGVAPTGDARADATAGIQKVRDLISRLGLPVRLSEVGVTEDQLDAIADLTLGDGAVYTNPRPVEDTAEVLELLKKAF